MCNYKYTISFFNGNCDRLPKREDLTFDELKTRLNRAARKKYTGKDNLEGMICGEFIKNKRVTECLIFRSIITYDIDNYKYDLEKLINDCESCLHDIKYLYYTTVSSTYLNPRIRILIFPNTNIATANYYNISEKVAIDIFSDDILHAIDKSSYSPIQLMYVPSIESTDFKCKSHDGDSINVQKYLNTKRPEQDAKTFIVDYKNLPLRDFNDEKVWQVLEEYDVEETGYHEWFAVCQALHHQYSGDEKGLELFIKWSLRDSRYTRDEVLSNAPVKYKSIRSKCENPITFASVIRVVNDKKKLPAKAGSTDFKALVPADFIDVKYNGKNEIIGVKSTYRNFELMCNHEDYKIRISYDVISKEIVNNFNENNQNNFVTIIQSAMVLNNMNPRFAINYINFMAAKNKMNSFKNAMDMITWDRVDRLESFYNTIKVDDNYKDIRDLYLLKWLQQMLYLTLSDVDKPRKIARNLLVLQGEQGCGKSTWVKSLLPTHLSHYIGEGLHLNASDSMSVLSCIKKIFVELAELEQSFKATDINQFKAFFGRTKDELNIKYLACPESYVRTTSFLGTVNENSFLKDKTGSTRFLVLPVKKLNGYHGIDMLQVYKQIIETTDYTNFELNEEGRKQQRIINEEFQQPDLIDEQFTNVYETEFVGEGIYQNCTEILERLGYSKRDINYTRRCDIANVIRNYNFNYRKDIKKWYVKLKKGEQQ